MKFSDFLQKQVLKSSNDLLSEASFKESDITRVMTLYKKLFAKYFGGEFKIFAEESYKRSSGEKGTGIRLINESGYQLRFNWEFSNSNSLKADNKSEKGKKLFISSIDYWEPINSDFSKPTSTLTFLKVTNVVEIWNGIAKVLKKNIKGKYKLSDFGAEVSEAAGKDITQGQRRQFAKQNGLVQNDVNDATNFDKIIKSKGLEDKFDEYVAELQVGKKESNSTSENLEDVEKTLESTKFSDPETVFQDIEDLTTALAKGKLKSLIILGQGGIGKTYHVTSKLKEILGEQNEGWYYHSGTKAAPFSFYRTVFTERDKTIVFDEADSLLKNPDIVMMLKPMLDTSGDNTIEYMSGTENMVGKSRAEIEDYCKQATDDILNGAVITASAKPKQGEVKLPSKYYFTGNIIFISNMKASQVEGAILSRSLFIDVYLAAQDVMKRIQSIMYAKHAKTMAKNDIDDIIQALGGSVSTSGPKIEYMTPELARQSKPLTVRSVELAIALKECGLSRWKELASLYA